MQNRYEEYVHFEDHIPFRLWIGIHRSAILASREANWHENVEIEYCNRGEGRVLIDGVSYPFQSGDMIAVNSGLIHHTGTEGELDYSCLIIDSAFCREAGIDLTAYHFTPEIHDPEANAIFLQICKSFVAYDDPLRVARLRMYALSLLLRLCEAHGRPMAGRAEDRHEDIKRALDYIRVHYRERITLDAMSEALYLNKYVLSRRFKSVVGMPLFSYIGAYRCNRAATLIAAGESVKSAALGAGFENMSFFAKTFRRYMGKNPSEYKKKG